MSDISNFIGKNVHITTGQAQNSFAFPSTLDFTGLKMHVWCLAKAIRQPMGELQGQHTIFRSRLLKCTRCQACLVQET